MQIAQVEKTADRISGFMKLLSTKQRLLILCNLVEGEMSVGELCEAVDMKPPAMSQQLAILRREGVLSPRRDGQSIYYAIANDDILKIMQFLYDTFCKPSKPKKKKG